MAKHEVRESGGRSSSGATRHVGMWEGVEVKGCVDECGGCI
jgi:hypothetical protein